MRLVLALLLALTTSAWAGEKDQFLVPSSGAPRAVTSSDGVYPFTNVAGGVSVGSAVYLSGPNKVAKASASTQPAFGLVYEITGNLSCNVLTSGVFVGYARDLVAGTAYYLSDTPGRLQDEPVLAGGKLAQYVGMAISSTDLLVDPQQMAVQGLTGGKLLALDANGKLPAVDASQLLNVPGGGGGGGYGSLGSTAHALVRTIGNSGYSASGSALICDDTGNLSGVGNISLSGTVDGVDVSTIPTSYQPVDATLTALAGATCTTSKLLYCSGSDQVSSASLTAAGLALLDDTDAAAQRTTLGLGTSATHASTDYQAASSNLTTLAGVSVTSAGTALLDDADAAAQRTTLGLGSASTHASTDFQAAGSYLVVSSNLSDLGSASTARTNLGLGSAATSASTDFQPASSNLTTLASVSVTSAGTALLDDADAAAQRTTLGLGSAATAATTDFQPASSNLTTLAGVSVTSAGTALLDDADAAAQRTTLGLGSAATHASTDFQAAGSYLVSSSNLSDLGSASTARTNLGLGTAALAASTDFQAAGSYQAQDATLTALAGATCSSSTLLYCSGTDQVSGATLTSAGLALLDDADAATQRTTLGLGSASTSATTDFQAASSNLTTLAGVSVTSAGTALLDDADAAAQRTTLGLGSAATSASTDFQSSDAELSAIAGLTSATDAAPYFTGSGTASTMTVTSTARTLLDDTSTGAMLTTLGAQASDTELSAIAGTTSAANMVSYYTGSGTATTTSFTQGGRALVGLSWSAGTQVPDLTAAGTAGLLTVGTAASNLVQLDGSAKLPAVDGSQLTGLSAIYEGGYAADSWTTTWQGTDGNGFWDSAWGTAPYANGSYQGKTATYLTNANSNNGGVAHIVTAMGSSHAGVEVRFNTYFVGATSGTTSNGYVRFDINGNDILLAVNTTGAMMWSGSGVTVQWNSAEPINQWVTWTIRVRSFQSTTAADGQIEVWAGEYFIGSCGLQQLSTVNYSSGRLVGIGRTGGASQPGVAWIKYKLGINAAPPSWTYRGLGFAGSVAP